MKTKSYLKTHLKSEITVLSPIELVDSEILKYRPISIKEETWIDCSQIIIDSIIKLSLRNNFKNEKKDDGFVSLSSEILKRKCGNNYSKVIDGLIKSGIIEKDNSYSNQLKKTYGYRLSTNYRFKPLERKEIKSYVICKNFMRELSNKKKELKPKTENLQHLLKWINDEGLEMNKSNALNFIDKYHKQLFTEVTNRKKNGKLTKKQLEKIDRKVKYLKYQVENWGKYNYFTIDDKGGRLYSPIVGLPSILRNFLTYKRQKLIGFDIKNSQPLHLILTMKATFWLETPTNLSLKSLDKELYMYLRGINNINTTIMFQDSSVSQYSIGFDSFETYTALEKSKLKKFISFEDLVRTGKLYEYISQKFYLSMSKIKDRFKFMKRDGAKKKFMHLMYHNPQNKFSSAKETFREFERIFPETSRIMALLKTRDHCDFPILLQKIEAEIILKIVTKRINDKNPSIPLFTIHDSILTTEMYNDYVKATIDEVYLELLGFIPQLEKISYSKLNAYLTLNKYVKHKASNIIYEEPNFFEDLKNKDLNLCENLIKNKYSLYPDFTKYDIGYNVKEHISTMYPNGKRLKK
jgi:hypothetical protein